MNTALALCRPHPSKVISEAVANDPEVIDLTVGEPWWGPPRAVVDAMLEQLRAGRPGRARHNAYAPARGVAALRDAIADRYRGLYGLEIDPDTQVLVTNGAAEALWLAVFALTEPGDRVVMCDPCYMLYEPIVASLLRESVRIPTARSTGFELDPDDVRGRAPRRTRALILNSPENPTGAVYEPETLRELVAVAVARGFHVVHDEVLDCFAFARPHVPALVFDPGAERTILVNSFSKRFGMTGWRIGWLVGSPEVVEQATKAHTYSSLATSTFVQQAVWRALNDPPVEVEVAGHVAAVRDQSCRFLQGLTTLPGFESVATEGSFYAFLDVTRFAHRTRDSISESVARLLLDRAKVAVVPGTAFGPGGEGYVRLTLVAPEAQLDEAVGRLGAALVSDDSAVEPAPPTR